MGETSGASWGSSRPSGFRWLDEDRISYPRFSHSDMFQDPRFSEGVVPEAENWVRKNFEEMREVLEPVSSAKLFWEMLTQVNLGDLQVVKLQRWWKDKVHWSQTGPDFFFGTFQDPSWNESCLFEVPRDVFCSHGAKIHQPGGVTAARCCKITRFCKVENSSLLLGSSWNQIALWICHQILREIHGLYNSIVIFSKQILFFMSHSIDVVLTLEVYLPIHSSGGVQRAVS